MRLSPAFSFVPIPRIPTRPSLVSLSIPAAEIRRKKQRHESRGWLRAQGAGKNDERDSNREEGEEVAAVMYLQGNETSGGSDGKEQGDMRENGRRVGNEPSR